MQIITLILSIIGCILGGLGFFFGYKSRTAIIKIIGPKIDESDKRFIELLKKLKKIL